MKCNEVILNELKKIKKSIDILIGELSSTSVDKVENKKHKNYLCLIEAKIQAETEKALLLKNEIEQGWVAKSQIKNTWTKNRNLTQQFSFPNWIRDKNFNVVCEV